jgi:hypothetical protein
MLLIVGAAALRAQFYGELSGTVTDPSGAVVPGASVTMKNQASGNTRETTSNNEGYFTIAAVPSGTYTVTVAAKGFKSWERAGIGFSPGDRRTLAGIVLQVGAASEAVRVEATPELVPLNSGEKSAVIGTNELQNMTMMGRSVDELLKILPGVAPVSGLGQGSWFNDSTALTNLGPGGAYTANGVQPKSMQLFVDGASIVDQGCNCTHTQVVNVDQIQEVKLQTSNFSAEFAKGPVAFTAVGKSGGSQFHGAAYFSARNNVLNSRDSNDKRQGVPKTDYHYYYPGGTVGGPVLIPGTNFNRKRNKLFFFAGYEYYNQIPPSSGIQTFVPTPDMLAGNFSQASLDALGAGSRYAGLQNAPTPALFPGGQVPVSLFDPNMVKMFKLLPQPNVDPHKYDGRNFLQQYDDPMNTWQARVRGDYSISDMTKLAVTYSMQNELDHNRQQLWGTPGDSVPYPTEMLGVLTSKITTVNFVHVFNPSLTNEVVFSNSRFVNNDHYADENVIKRATVGISFQGVFKNGNPMMPNIVGNDQGMPAISGVPAVGIFFGAVKQGLSLSDNLTKVFSTHTVKAGFYWDWIGNMQSSSTPANGTLNFSIYGNALTTGNEIVDALLGKMSSYSEAQSSPVTDIYYSTVAFYAQDSWKVNKRLTLEYGMRFDHLGQWKDRQGIGMAAWYPAAYSNNPAQLGKNTGVSWRGLDSSVPNGGSPTRALFYSPRFGLAYDILGNGKTVLRGGWGQYRFQMSSDSVRGAMNVSHANIQYNSPAPLLVSQIDAQAFVATVSKGSMTTFSSTDDQQPLTTSYSFSVTQSLPGKSVAEFGYVGSQTAHGWMDPLAGINQVPLGALFQADPITGAPANPGSANIDNYRPMRNYSGVTVYTHGAYQNYNALQVTWRKSTSRHFFSVNYTFGKNLGMWGGDNGGVVNYLPGSEDVNYGPVSYDHTHLFNASYSYQLPSPVRGNAVLKGIVNGWQVSGITLIQSGAPIQPNEGGNLNMGITGVSNRTWLGTDAVNLQPVVICDPRSGLRANQHMNPNCFAPPTALGIGNNGNIELPYMKGEPFFSSDLTILKNFKISESKRIQFRAAGNNFLNHPLHSFTNGNAEQNLNFNGTSPLTTNASTFGVATNTGGYRQIYFTLRFEF